MFFSLHHLDYHYVTREAMQSGINNGEFIEHAEFSGNMYGTSKAAVQAVQAKNLICILDIDMQGVKSIKNTDLNPIYISIQPPSVEVLVSAVSALTVRRRDSEFLAEHLVMFSEYFCFIVSGKTPKRQKNGVGGEPPEAFKCSQGGHGV